MCLYLDRLQLPNGLFHHAKDAPFVWGRGAGWMAAAMPIVLKYLEPDSPFRARILEGFRRMMAALLGLQRPNGLWGQLVDDAEAWYDTGMRPIAPALGPLTHLQDMANYEIMLKNSPRGVGNCSYPHP